MLTSLDSLATAPSTSVLAAAGAWRCSARFRDRAQPIPRHGTTAHERRGLVLMVNRLAVLAAGRRRGAGSHASCRPRCATFAAPARGLGVVSVNSAPARRSPGDGAAPCRPPSKLLAADARVLFPIARAASRGLAQPGFNEVAPCFPSSTASAARPRRNLSVIRNKRMVEDVFRRGKLDADHTPPRGLIFRAGSQAVEQTLANIRLALARKHCSGLTACLSATPSQISVLPA